MQPIVHWEPQPEPAPEPPVAGPAVALWQPGFVGVSAFILGYPAGIALAGQNWWRTGHRALAIGHLIGGVAIFFGLFLLPDTAPRGIAIWLSIGLAVYFYQVAKSQAAAAAAHGLTVQVPRARFAILPMLGAWALVFLPVATLIFLGSNVSQVLAGTAEFGTGGSSCDVTGSTSTFDVGQRIRIVAWPSKSLQVGDKIHIVLLRGADIVDAADLAIDGPAGCLTEDFAGGLDEPGNYTIIYTLEGNRIASGDFEVH